MRRRYFFTSGALLVTSLAGCTTNNQTGNRDGISYFEEELVERNIDVKNIHKINNKIELIYETERTTDQGLGDEIGTISASYVLAREEGLDTDKLVSTINNGDEDVAMWHIKEDWINQFEAGEISPDEFTARILDSVELVE